MANNLLSSNPVLSYSTPRIYPGPTAHRIADLPRSILKKKDFTEQEETFWMYPVNPLTCNQDSSASSSQIDAQSFL